MWISLRRIWRRQLAIPHPSAQEKALRQNLRQLFSRKSSEQPRRLVTRTQPRRPAAGMQPTPQKFCLGCVVIADRKVLAENSCYPRFVLGRDGGVCVKLSSGLAHAYRYARAHRRSSDDCLQRHGQGEHRRFRSTRFWRGSNARAMRMACAWHAHKRYCAMRSNLPSPPHPPPSPIFGTVLGTVCL